MDLSGIWSVKDKKKKEYYWSIIIEPGWVQAGIWSIEDGKVEVASSSHSSAWESDDELVTAADASLSACIQSLPEDETEPSKTVFGVLASWVGEGQIKEEYLAKIKRVCSDLSLEPVGFVVLAEAISHYIRSKEGGPLSAIVLGSGKDSLEVSVFRVGQLVGNQVVARSISASDDVMEGLSRFGSGEPLPSRVILYDGKEGELEDIKENLMSASWEGNEKVKFLHTPKIEVVPIEEKILATSLAGGAELAQATKVEKTIEQYEEVTGEANVEEVSENEAEKLGFVVNKDVAISGQEEPRNRQFGVEEQVSQAPLEHERVESGRRINKISALFFSIAKIFRQASNKLHPSGSSVQPKISGVANTRKTLYVGGVAFLLFLIIGTVFWWYYPKAKVTIFVSPQSLEDNIAISVDPGLGSLDLNNNSVPGQKVSKSISGEKTKSTSGIKTVGEKAKGEVTLYRAGPQLTLKAGTVLVGPSSLEFTLNEDATVASGSAGSPGTTKVKVTAKDIGAQFNLAANETFGVSNYPTSDIEAKNESAFTEGSSHEISAVSKEDQETLEEDLTSELLEKAGEEIASGLTEDKLLIKESLQSKVTDRQFSNKPGDEASSLKLSLTLELTGLVVGKSDVTNLAKEVLKSKVASGFVLRENQISVKFEFEEKDGDVVKLKTFFKANLLPEIKLDELATKIAGKYPTLAKEYLNSIPGFVRANIDISPKFPGRLGVIPRVKKNIIIEITAE